MKIHPFGAELFHAEEKTEMKLIVTSRNSENTR